jgi:hypothetical protein
MSQEMFHPKMKDEHGNALINMKKIDEYLMAKSLEMVKSAADRIGIFTQECSKANECLESEFKSTGLMVSHAKEMKKEVIDTFRAMRMTTTTEVAAMVKPLEELRKFFLGEDHQKEVDRLREFVDLCERLEKLKASGFLDTVADTMLKLS